MEGLIFGILRYLLHVDTTHQSSVHYSAYYKIRFFRKLFIIKFAETVHIVITKDKHLFVSQA